MEVVIIGTGNVATVLGRKIAKAGHTILQVHGRRKAATEELASELNSMACHTLSDIVQTADLYIIAISDDALYELPLNLGDKLTVHTAGSVPAAVLKNISSNYGVLYPLQSLRKELAASTGIPLLVDANNDRNKQQLIGFAKTISEQVGEADDMQRMKLHVAAVIAGNFTNHLYALAEDYCKKEMLDFSLLYPLIQETAQRIQSFSPAQMQTGPAARNDEVTIANHLSLLQSHPALQQLYRQLTESIREGNQKQ